MSHLGDLLSAHLDGELLGHERARVAGHLQECERCRAELTELAAARSLVRSLPILELPTAVREAVGMAPDPLPLRRHPGMWIGAAAAAAAVLFVGAAIVTAPKPQQISPPELTAVYGAVSSNEPAFGVVKVSVASNAVAEGAR
ncbi:MAG: anti-sigma factor family protein [Acidimicrobiia bacterium]